MYRLIKAILLFCAIFAIIFFAYFSWIPKYRIYKLESQGYHVGFGAIFAESIGRIAIQKGDPTQCEKIMIDTFTLVGWGGGPDLNDLKSICYYVFSEENKNEALCSQVPEDSIGGTGITSAWCRELVRKNNQ